jgi:hypothetical protein
MNVHGLEVDSTVLNGLETDQINTFLRKRAGYKNTGVTALKRIVPISVKASIDPSLLSLICMFELKKYVDSIHWGNVIQRN